MDKNRKASINRKALDILKKGGVDLIESPNLSGRTLRKNIALALRRQGWNSKYATSYGRKKLIDTLERKIKEARTGNFSASTARTINAAEKGRKKENVIFQKEVRELNKTPTAMTILNGPSYEWKEAVEFLGDQEGTDKIIDSPVGRMTIGQLLQNSPEINFFEKGERRKIKEAKQAGKPDSEKGGESDYMEYAILKLDDGTFQLDFFEV